jgi:flagellar basal-body rod protein FlgB
MLNRLDDMLNFHASALRLRGERQEVLASNIANADTPGFKARDMDFRAALSDAVGAKASMAQSGGQSGVASALATTAAAHLSGSNLASAGSTAGGATLLYRTPLQDSVDGNTVNIDAERSAFAENALRYEFNLTRINQQLKGLMSAIQG